MTLRKNIKGASVIEYGILVSLVAVFSISTIFSFGRETSANLGDISSSLGEQVLSGVSDASQSTSVPSPPALRANGIAEDCYDSLNIGTVGDSAWAGCGGMLIVDNTALQAAGSDRAGGSGLFAIIGPDGNTYTFEDSERNVFTGQVTDMDSLFRSTTFNGDIGYWDTSSVENMRAMFFDNANFNQDISGWDTSSVNEMRRMFEEATSFNQDLSGWCVSNIPFLQTNFDADASSWSLPRPVWGTCPSP